jgi:hypothetical protein
MDFFIGMSLQSTVAQMSPAGLLVKTRIATVAAYKRAPLYGDYCLPVRKRFPVLLRLPPLFSAAFVTPAANLDHLEGVAQRLHRLMRAVLIGVLVLSGLALTGLVDDSRLMLPWLAKTWPTLFEPVLALAQLPMTPVEVVGSLAILALFLGVYAHEAIALRSFQEDLVKVDEGSSIRDAVRRLETSSPAVAAYVRAVLTVRALRQGDWRIARELAEQPKK